MTEQDFRGVTIDASHSRDLDDAVWVERVETGWKVTVSIALACAAVHNGSDLDLAARNSGFSRYSADAVSRPMLPKSLSEDGLSLTPGKPHQVLAFVINLDGNLDFTHLEMGLGMLVHEGRLSHEQAEELINGGPERLHGMIKDAWELCSGLLEARRRAGALAYFSSRSGLMTDEEGRLVSVGTFSSTARPYLIVQELMILTNRVVAEHFARSGTPLLFRNHRGNPVADCQALSDDLRILSEGGPYSETAGQRFEMMLGRATLSSKAVGHFGLNLPVYAWLTSPIRRYADLVNQRIVVASLAGEPSPYAQEELDFIGDQLNELAVKDAEEKTEHFKRLATRRAVQQQERGNIQDLDAAEMKTVIKTAAASNAFSPELGVELGRRLSDGSLSPKNMARILFARGKGVAQAQEDVMRRPQVSANDAVSVLNYLTQENLISGLDWSDENGTSALEMTASARRNGAVLSATVPGPSKKVAKQRAAVALLAKISGTDWLPPEDWSTANPKVVIQLQPGADLNSKGALIALCRERGLPTPIFEISQEGSSHAPQFTAYASVETGNEKLSAGPFLAGSRKEAERTSAEALLRRLADYKAVPTNTSSAAVSSNPKSALQEFCQKRGWPLPVYEIFSQEGPSHQPSFKGVAQVRAPGGN